MRLAAVTLDAAGTLIEVAERVGRTYARTVARHGIHLVPEQVERTFAAALAAAPPLAFPGVAAVERAERERAWWEAVVRQAFADAGELPSFGACFAELFAYYARPAAWRVFPEVPGTLRQLRARGLHLAVVSNFDARLGPLLDGLGLGPLLDHVLHSSAAGAAKPDAAIFRAAVAALGAPAPDVLHAGDGLVADVTGAREAGLRAVLVDRRGEHPHPPAGIQRIVALDELLGLAL